MARIAIIECTMFLIWPTIFLAVAQADQTILDTTVVNENGEEIPLKWVETEPLLANENLPIWLTTVLPDYVEQDLHIMREIGTFKTYHDLQQFSAVVLIEKWNCIFGTIDVRYTIACLPLDQLYGHKHKIGESKNVVIMDYDHVPNHQKIFPFPSELISLLNKPKLGESADEMKMLIKTLVDDSSTMSHHQDCTNRKSMTVSSNSRASLPPKKRPRMHYNYVEQVITVYPEILTLVPNEVVRTAEHLITIVLRYVVQFNSIAMLFAQLATHNVKIHINMAGLIIEKNRLQFPFTSLFENRRPSGVSVLDSVTEYIKHVKILPKTKNHEEQPFTDDSFDMFLLSTMNEWQALTVNTGGISTSVFDLSDNRKSSAPIEAKKFLGSIVGGANIMQHYVNAAREIAHLMAVEDDPRSTTNRCTNKDQCQAIMQTNRHCPTCLKWSSESVKSFKKYLSTNSNRCFLRNRPRSLHPYGQPLKSLVPADQCLCHGYRPGTDITHLSGSGNNCERMLQCTNQNNEWQPQNTLFPVDGTPCDENDNDKVCWNRQCISTKLQESQYP